MSQAELHALAGEVRSEIIRVVSRQGGHLGSNLGVVELTIALHSVLRSPEDKIVWDVGHQAYSHKLLTGRYRRFETLRCRGGLSGYPRREESPHDVFGTGHASTSISAALGLATARDLSGQRFNVVAVIGDGALTGGMAFEALNHAGDLGTDLVVVLNDNEMSIAPNVGALSTYLTRARMDSSLQKAREDFEQLLRRIPAVGGKVARATERLKESLKLLLVPGRLFEELGFTYFGPIDGHDIRRLQKAIRDAVHRGGPVLVHALTRKGYGFEPAQAQPERFHSCAPFDAGKRGPGRKTGAGHREVDPVLTAATGSVLEQPSYSEAFGEALVNLAQTDSRIVAITAAMPSGTGLDRFREVLPHRFLDVGIAEQHAVTMAAGLACAGMRPVVAIYSSFLQRAFDQIIHDVCLQRLPVIFAVDRAGLVGEDGPTHHGAFDLSYLRLIPNMTVMAPSSTRELAQMLKAAVSYGSPVAIRYPRGRGSLDQAFHGDVPGGDGRDGAAPPRTGLEPGKAELLAEGGDLALIAVGAMVQPALNARRLLAEKGISASVVNARFVKPIDEALILELASRTKRLVTVEENSLAGGFGSAVAELLATHLLLGVILHRIGLPDEFVEHGDLESLRRHHSLTGEGIALRATQAVEAGSTAAGAALASGGSDGLGLRGEER